MFGRLSIAFIVVSLTALLCAQSADAAKGPRVTHKVFFDIKHGDESMGRSTYMLEPHLISNKCAYRSCSRYGSIRRSALFDSV